MIRGFFVEGRPVIPITVRVPRLNTSNTLGFLVDTGADTSVIHPFDAEGLRIDTSLLAIPQEIHETLGVGGISREWREDVVLILHHVDRRQDQMGFSMSFAVTTEDNRDLPSLMGMDLLRRYRLTVDLQADIVTLQ